MDKWAAYHQAQPAENVDWAQLAQQWMAMKEQEEQSVPVHSQMHGYPPHHQQQWHGQQHHQNWGNNWTNPRQAQPPQPPSFYNPPPPSQFFPAPPGGNYIKNSQQPNGRNNDTWRTPAPKPMFPSAAHSQTESKGDYQPKRQFGGYDEHSDSGYGSSAAPQSSRPPAMFAAHANDHPASKVGAPPSVPFNKPSVPPPPPPQGFFNTPASAPPSNPAPVPKPTPSLSSSGHFFNNDAAGSGPVPKPVPLFPKSGSKGSSRSEESYEELGYMPQQNYPMDAATRKKLPAWILEGLEKADREKQKQLEKEEKIRLADEERAKRRAESGKSKFDSSSDEEDEDGREEFQRRETSDFTPTHDTDSDDDTIEERREAFMKCVKVLMMNVLLDASNDAIMNLVQEGIENREKKKKERLANAAPQIVSNSSALAALAAFGDGEDSDDDEEEDERRSNRSRSRDGSPTNASTSNEGVDFKTPMGIPTRKFSSKPEKATSSQMVELNEGGGHPKAYDDEIKKDEVKDREKSSKRKRSRSRERRRSPEKKRKRSRDRKRSRSSERKRKDERKRSRSRSRERRRDRR